MKNNRGKVVALVVVGIILLGCGKAITGVISDLFTIVGGLLIVAGIVEVFKKQKPTA